MPARLTGRIALITGSSSGIGRATALAFSREGAKVICADLTPSTWRTSPSSKSNEASAPTHEAIIAAGGTAHFITTDVTCASAVQAAVAFAVATHGRLDIMINNAGFALEARVECAAPIWDLSLDVFHRTQACNVAGVFYGIKYAAAQMVAQEPLPSGDRGWILSASSIFGLAGTPGAAAYCASKGAVANLTRAAALDCAPFRVHVNAVCPGYVATHMTDEIFADEGIRGELEGLHPFRGLGKVEDVAGVYVFLASEEAGWMTGVNLPVDGGFLAR